MPAAEARVPTPRADRYLTQLTSHTGQMRRAHLGGRHRGGQHAPVVQDVTRTGNRALITFDWGTCTAIAEPDELKLLAEAPDPTNLERGTELLTRRIRTIGRREDLTVTWHRTDDPSS